MRGGVIERESSMSYSSHKPTKWKYIYQNNSAYVCQWSVKGVLKVKRFDNIESAIAYVKLKKGKLERAQSRLKKKEKEKKKEQKATKRKAPDEEQKATNRKAPDEEQQEKGKSAKAKGKARGKAKVKAKTGPLTGINRQWALRQTGGKNESASECSFLFIAYLHIHLLHLQMCICEY